MELATTDDVLDLLDSHITAAALGAAMELGLFWLLADQPLDAAGVAQKLGIPITRCRHWLRLLSNAGLLEPVAAGYASSAIARTAILDKYSQETWAFLAREARERFPVVRDLALRIREPGSTWAAQGLTPPNYIDQMNEDPERARQFTRMLYEIHLPFADEVARFLDMRGVGRLMDLGGGSGVVSVALLRRYPHLAAVVVDIANVCAVGRDIARENGMGERLSYYAASFLEDDLPLGFDLILECDVGVYDKALFQKMLTALNPGGRLVIIDQFAPAAGVASPSRLHWAFTSSLEDPDAAYPTANEIQALLTQAGFQLLSESPLPKKESLRWSGDWVVIEAQA